LKNIATKRGVKLQTNTNKLLASLFNNQETETYVSVINKLLVGGSVQLSNDTVLSASNAFNSFSDTLRSDQDLFTSDRGTVEQETIDLSELFGQDFDDAITLNEQSESSQKQIQLVQHKDANDNIQNTHDPEYWLKKVREALDKEAWTEAVSSGQKALFYNADFVKADIVLAYAFGRLRNIDNSLFYIERVDRLGEVEAEVYRSLLSTLELYFLSVFFGIFTTYSSEKLEKIAKPLKITLSKKTYEEIKTRLSENINIHFLGIKSFFYINLPKEIGQLTNLIKLSISVTYQLTNLPKEIGQLKNLTSLELYRNHLTSLPKEIGQLTNLTELYLEHTGITSLPKEIGQLVYLIKLSCWNNQLISLPKEIGQLKNLTSLDLYNNHLTSLPKEIGQLTNLKFLKLDNNQLTSLPKEIGQLTNLTSLDLAYNQLTSLPKEIGQLKNLTSLELYRNHLTSLPKEMGLLNNLIFLRLDSNEFTNLSKEIRQITNLTSLKKLRLDSNQLTNLPKEIGQLTNLISLELCRNQLTNLPEEIGQLTNLISLYIASNQLTTLSKEIGLLTNLTTLDLDNNQLTTLPKEISYLTNLNKLNLSRNNFSGSEQLRIRNLLRGCHDINFFY
jgi:Leucine-rich repeat (LRR) protein